jgi:hypothetical protein
MVGITAIEGYFPHPYCYILFWSMPSSPKRLSLVTVITTNILVNRMAGSLGESSLEGNHNSGETIDPRDFGGLSIDTGS